jgi:hypothetical protein
VWNSPCFSRILPSELHLNGETILIDWPTLAIGAVLGLPIAIAGTYAYEILREKSRLRANNIQIESPRPGEHLQDPRPYAGANTYQVSGKVGFLPRGYNIWLLVRRPLAADVWPQGFRDGGVQYDPASQRWKGRVLAHPGPLTVIAVVAPPTSQMLFAYYQRNGKVTNYEPLEDIPAECTNSDFVSTSAE